MKTKFSPDFLNHTIHKTPLKSLKAQNFFRIWCHANDSITPTFLSREDREDLKVKNSWEILSPLENDTYILALPEDLHLWEMPEIIVFIDSLESPQKALSRQALIQDLARNLMLAANYLTEHLPLLEGKAKVLALELSLSWSWYALRLGADERVPLTPQNEAMVEKWLLWETAYQKRLERLALLPSEEIPIAKALSLKKVLHALTREGTKHQETFRRHVSSTTKLQQTVQNRILKALQTPQKEFLESLFHRGMMLLTTKIAPTPEMWEVWNSLQDPTKNILIPKTLYELLEIPQKKAELDLLRASDNLEVLGQKEREIAQYIQSFVSRYPYEDENKGNGSPESPAVILKKRFLNCVWASVLGGGLLDHLGINYVHVDLPSHSATLLLTSDHKVYWQDFTPLDEGFGEQDDELNYTELTPKILIAPCDFWNLPEGWLPFGFRPELYDGAFEFLTAFPPHQGFQCHILNNLAVYLEQQDQTKEALVASKWGMNLGLCFSSLHNTLWNVYDELHKPEKAIDAYMEGIRQSSEMIESYLGLWNVYLEQEDFKKAKQVLRKGIELSPDFTHFYNALGDVYATQGKFKKALKMYQIVLSKDDNSKSCYYGIGQVHFLQKNREAAIENLTRFLSINTEEDEWSKEAQIMLKKAKKQERISKQS